VVVAHEFGHHVHHDLWWTLAVDSAAVVAGLAVSGAVLRAAAMGPGDLAALPLVGLATWGTFIAATPLRHALSRWQERRADAFALELTGGAAEFRAALRRLGRAPPGGGAPVTPHALAVSPPSDRERTAALCRSIRANVTS
jgi:STE24 endopeptidase